MTTTHQNHADQISALPAIGSLTWKFLGKTHTVDVTEVEVQFEDENEYFIRYRGACNFSNPLVRVKGTLVYFLTERSANGELDWPEFESKGCKGKLSLFNQ